MTRHPTEPRVCREDGCDVRVILARRVPDDRWRAYEARDRAAFTQDSIGAYVVVAGQAWRPADLVEHYMVRHELTESRAKEVVSGFPFHRAHFHIPETDQHAPTVNSTTNQEKRTTHP